MELGNIGQSLPVGHDVQQSSHAGRTCPSATAQAMHVVHLCIRT